MISIYSYIIISALFVLMCVCNVILIQCIRKATKALKEANEYIEWLEGKD